MDYAEERIRARFLAALGMTLQGPAAGMTPQRLTQLAIRQSAIINRQLQGRAVVAEQRFAKELEWNYSLAHESVVKVLQSEITPLFLFEIIAQLQDLQLAQSVDEVGWITGSTF